MNRAWAIQPRLSLVKKIAILKARVRLAKAGSSYQSLSVAASYEAISDDWTNFLLAANSIFSILEKGAKDNPQSRQWYGGKKKEGKLDPLIRYINQARNADEHGIEPVTELKGGYLSILPSEEGPTIIQRIVILPSHIEVTTPQGYYPPELSLTPNRVVLIPVYDDRYGGAWYQPPKEHLGRPIEDDSIVGIAELTISYLSSLIDEAEGFAS